MLIMLNKAPDKEVIRTSGQKPFHFCMLLNFPNLRRGKFGINEKKKFIATKSDNDHTKQTGHTPMITYQATSRLPEVAGCNL